MKKFQLLAADVLHKCQLLAVAVLHKCQLLAVAVLHKCQLFVSVAVFENLILSSSSLQWYSQRKSLMSVRDELTVVCLSVGLSVSTCGSRRIRKVFFRMSFVSALKYFLTPNE